MKLIPQQITWTSIAFFLATGAFPLRAMPFPPSCLPPSGITVLSSSSVSATFSWSAAGASGTVYEWEIGLSSFTPGNNEYLFRQSTADTLAFASGLVSATTLKLSLRTICGAGDTSAWSDPVLFSTAPGCNDIFSDPGGLLGNYPNSVMDTALICPPSDTEVVQLTFFSFATQPLGDYLKIYDGTDASAPQLANLSGVFLPPFEPLPGPYTASNASGCLYVLFFSNAQLNDEGWAALVSCTTPDSCLALSGLSVDSVGASFAQVSWMPSFGAQWYEWELGVAPYAPGGSAVQADTTSADTLLLTGLASNTSYALYVRSKCDSTSVSDWVSVAFSMPLSCGDTLYDSGGPGGDYGENENFNTTICPDSTNHTVTLSFLDLKTQQGQDILSVYDGPDTLAPLIMAYSGNPNPAPVVTATNATGCLTVQFFSDGNNNQPGWAATVSCDTATDCYTLLDLNLDFVAKDSASISWTPIFGAAGYIWELDTVPFTPGAGSPFQSDTTDVSSLNFSALMSGHSYVLYVRTLCAMDTSTWFGPLNFNTPPGCGDKFFDSGGINGDYGNGEDFTTVICPDTAGEVVTLTFTNLKFKTGDTLTLYNGNTADPLLLLGTLTGNPPAPGPFSATVANGCITAHFRSDTGVADSGWVALVTCAAPAACYDVLFPHLDSISGSSASFSWFGVAGAVSYEWKFAPVPYVPGMVAALDSGIVSGTSLTLSGLDQLTTYTLWIRTICAADTTPFSLNLSFTTSVDCFSGNAILCGDTSTVTINGVGNWDLKCDTSGISNESKGRETVFAFTAPVTKSYQFNVDSVSGGYMDFYFKEASDGCNPLNWTCIGDFNQKDSAVFGPLVAGTTYLILADPEQTTATSAWFRISDCAPVNDDAAGAIHLAVNDLCLGSIHSNATATLATTEPNPDAQTGTADTISGRWKTAAGQTVWFKFEAPASGTVTVSTAGLSLSGNFDTRIALYEAPTPADYSTFKYLDSDEDNGTLTDSLNAVLSYTGLSAGETYYVQVDGDGASPGVFCIQVLDGVYRFNDGACADTFSVSAVDGLAPGGDHWYGIYGGQDQLRQGRLIAAIRPGPQNLDTVACQLLVYSDSIPYSSNNVAYMPAYFKLSASQAPIHPSQVRLFFYNFELNALKLKTGLLSNTADDLNVSQYIGPNPDCTPVNHSTADVDLLDTVVQAVNTGGTASFYLEFSTLQALLGEFGAHFGSVALPVELRSFTGTVRNIDNMLEWTTASEKNVLWHILERSFDAVIWTELGRLAGSLSANEERYYHWADTRPAPSAYYRIRTVDADGKAQFSNAILLVRQKDRLSVLQAYPSPTAELLNIQIVAPGEREVILQFFDLNGRLLLQQTQLLHQGVSTVPVRLSALPPGVYALSVSDSTGRTVPVRIVKQ